MNPVIVVVGYNRPLTLLRLLESISKAQYPNNEITLIISIDKATNFNEVNEIAEKFEWIYGEKIIRTFNERQGLRNHILQCGQYTSEYGSAIILEDDLIVSPGFYLYTQQALDFYADSTILAGISLYSHDWNGYANRSFLPIADTFDVYLAQFSITWGQCWTKAQWENFEKWYHLNLNRLDVKDYIPSNVYRWSEKSWGKYFVYYIVENGLFYLIPRISLSSNCSEIGEHVSIADNNHQVRLLSRVDNSLSFRFGDVEILEKYDIFFENMKIREYFSQKIQDDGLLIDLYGKDRNDENCRYLLSTLSKPFRIIKSYGLQYRPHEMNVIHNVPGDTIFLYDKRESSVCKKVNYNKIIRYEIRGISFRKLIPYSLENGYFSIRRYIKNQVKLFFSKQ